MKIFVWSRVENVTSEFHNGGAVLVVAESLERALALVPRIPEAEDPYPYRDRDEPIPEVPAPDAVYDLAGPAEERKFVFPDAGCC